MTKTDFREIKCSSAKHLWKEMKKETLTKNLLIS